MNDLVRDDVPFDLFRGVRLVRRHLALLAVIVVVVAAAVAAPLLAGGRTYGDSAQVQIGQTLDVNSVIADTSAVRTDAARLADEQTRLAESDGVLATAEAAMPKGHPDYDVSVSSESTSDVITISATSTSGATATQAANAVAAAYIKTLQNANNAVIDTAVKQLTASVAALDTQLTALQNTLNAADSTSLARVSAVVGPTRTALLNQRTTLQQQLDHVNLVKATGSAGGAKVVQEAQGATASLLDLVSPVVLGLLLGLIVGLLVIWLRERTSGRLVTTEDGLAAGFHEDDVVVVTAAGSGRRGAGSRGSRIALDSAWQRLAFSLLPVGTQHGPVLLVSASGADVEPELAATHISRQLSRLSRPVVVVNGTTSDLDAAQLGAGFVHLGTQEAATRLEDPSLGMVLVSDGAATDVASLTSPALLDALVAASRRASVVIIGSAVDGSADSLALAPIAEHVVVLAVRGRTRRTVAARAHEEISRLTSGAAHAQRSTLVVLDRALLREDGAASAAPEPRTQEPVAERTAPQLDRASAR